MSASTKSSNLPTARRKSFKPTKIVTLKLSPKALQKFPSDSSSVSRDDDSSRSSDAATTAPQPPVAANSNGDNASASNANTPAAAGTPSSSMPPPTETVKKKPGKRSAPSADPNAPPKVRGKPGPKKKARLEDGSIDHSAPVPRAANAHKLGPRANQGTINANLRALDRSGKPCRKWAKAEFKMKSFTGVVWELPRWRAPPKISTESTSEGQSASGDSSKENKENSQQDSVKSEKSNSGDIEMGNTPDLNVASPASSLPGGSTTVSALASAAVPASA